MIGNGYVNDSILKTDRKFELVRLIAAAYQVSTAVGWAKNNQISLTCKSSERELSCQEAAHGSATLQSLVGGQMVRDDSEYTEFIAGFKHTYFYDIWNELSAEYGIHRMRLMRLEPKGCLSFHKDFYSRYHVPIVTNDSCFVMINESRKEPWLTGDLQIPSIHTYHLPANGNMYWVDTTKRHTVYNGGDTDRIHLVCSLND